MSILDKLMFWKKKDDFNLGNDFGAGNDPFASGPNAGFGQQGDPFGSQQNLFANPSANDPFAGPEQGHGQSFGQLGGPFSPPSPSMSTGASGKDPFGRPVDSFQTSMNQGSYGGNLARQMPMQQPFQSSPPQQVMMPQPNQYQGVDLASKEFEIVSSKLDSIRYSIESINQRLANLERMAGADNQQRKYQW